MKYYGLALLPDERTQRQFIDFQSKHAAHLSGPVLGLERNIPHLTVLQCPFMRDQLTDELLDEVVRACKQAVNNTTSRIGELYLKPVGWVFAHIAEAWIHDVQDAAMFVMESVIDRTEIFTDEPYYGYSYTEIASYEHYGYRYVGDAFQPHITVGRTLPGVNTLDDGVRTDFDLSVRNQECKFTELVFCEVGESGVLTEVIASHSLM